MWTNRNIERESVFAFQGPSAGSPSPTSGCVWRGTQLLLAYLTMLRYNIAPTIYPGVHTSSSYIPAACMMKWDLRPVK